ncbi:hypothetical protein [Stenotrophomonas sp.]|uniref:hypothetical protein n=1 Tax=Stenotrophomonas sp. TaxID=69392 RepID=UPI002FC984E0
MQSRSHHRLGALALALALLAASGCKGGHAPSADASASGPLPASITREAVHGTPLAEWTANWWRWAEAQPTPPYADTDGSACAVGQRGPVWFLAGTDGSFQPQRTCHVPAGRHVLLPVINMLVYQGNAFERCSQMQADAAVNNQHLRAAEVLLDGQSLGDIHAHRVASDGCFPLDAGDGEAALAAADGYWLMLKPLSPGRHTLQVRARYDTPQGGAFSGLQQDFDYVLLVGDAAAPRNAAP